jgi:hypothetical protein
MSAIDGNIFLSAGGILRSNCDVDNLSSPPNRFCVMTYVEAH